jgi:hypothetical protein
LVRPVPEIRDSLARDPDDVELGQRGKPDVQGKFAKPIGTARIALLDHAAAQQADEIPVRLLGRNLRGVRQLGQVRRPAELHQGPQQVHPHLDRLDAEASLRLIGWVIRRMLIHGSCPERPVRFSSACHSGDRYFAAASQWISRVDRQRRTAPDGTVSRTEQRGSRQSKRR